MTMLYDTAALRAERLRGDPAFRTYWERTALARAVAIRLVQYRVEQHLTQTELARWLEMRQPVIARLEAGEHNPSMETLLRLSNVLGMEFLIHVAPTNREERWPDPATDAATVREQVQAGKSAVVATAR